MHNYMFFSSHITLHFSLDENQCMSLCCEVTHVGHTVLVNGVLLPKDKKQKSVCLFSLRSGVWVNLSEGSSCQHLDISGSVCLSFSLVHLTLWLKSIRLRPAGLHHIRPTQKHFLPLDICCTSVASLSQKWCLNIAVYFTMSISQSCGQAFSSHGAMVLLFLSSTSFPVFSITVPIKELGLICIFFMNLRDVLLLWKISTH